MKGLKMKEIRRWITAAALGFAATTQAAGPVVEVFKSPTCGCCTQWVDHLRANGYTVNANDVPDPSAYRARYGVPNDLGSCHTAVVGGYAIEGHVPAREIRRLLAERPKARGLAVPGMPAGSPGMEGPRADPYQVLLVQQDGGRLVYANYHGGKASEPAAQAALAEGEVRKVDKETKKVTIKHGPIQNLDMPAMTMVFQVQDPGVLDRVKSGDKVKFRAEKINGAYTVTRIEQ